MAVQNFALDATGSQRIQIHWSSESSTITVLLNGSILGILETPQDHEHGKDFTLPDNSPLHVQMINGWPQCWRFGQPLMPVAADVSTEVKAPKKRSGCLSTFIIFVIVVLSIGALVNVIGVFGALSGQSALPIGASASSALLNIAGVVGLGALLAWKKWGFYLYAAAVILGLLATLLLQHDAVSIVACVFRIIIFGVFYFWLNRSGVWDNLQ